MLHDSKIWATEAAKTHQEPALQGTVQLFVGDPHGFVGADLDL